MVSGTTVLLGIGKTLERWSVQRMTQTQRQASLCLPGLAVLVSSRSRVPLAPRRRQGRRAVQAHPSYHHRSAARAPQTLLCLHVQLDAISYGIGTIGNLHTGSVALIGRSIAGHNVLRGLAMYAGAIQQCGICEHHQGLAPMQS